MADSVKASLSGLERIDQARRRKGWNKTSQAWCTRAFISRATLSRFWSGKPIRRESFLTICQAVNIDWEEVVETQSFERSPTQPLSQPPLELPLCHDWGQAPDVSIFCGREAELALLHQWIIQERCRLVSLLGMGGIGKTALAVKFAQQQKRFKFVIWRSLRNAPLLEDLLSELVVFFSQGQETVLPTHLDGKILRLLTYWRATPCLLILDNVESIIQSGETLKEASLRAYRDGYESYGQLLRCFGETAHNSTLIITSREPPQGLVSLEGKDSPVRGIQLQGVSQAPGRKILSARGIFTATENDWQALIERYAGNPLALKIVSSYIRDFFDGSISQFLDFLQQGPFVFDDIRDLLAQQFCRLSGFEQQLITWLAINREAVTYQELLADFVRCVSAGNLLQALISLKRRSLIEKTEIGFTLQPVVMEYAIAELIEQVVAEFSTGKLEWLKSHALVKAQAKDYVSKAQVCLILKPVIEQLSASGTTAIKEQCLALLASLRGKTPLEVGYAGGNLVNLLRQMSGDLSDYDFSNLTIWQADLQGINLHRVNFAHSNLAKSVFTQTFGSVLTVAFSVDGQYLAAGDGKGEIHLWQVANAQLLLTLPGHSNWVQSVAFSPNGQILASGSDDKTIRLWDLTTGQRLRELQGHTNSVRSLAFSPNGKKLASSSTDGTVRLWDVATGRRLKVLSGHSHSVWSVSYSPQGKLLASSSSDGTIKLWDTQTGQEITTLVGHTRWVWTVAFSPDGRLLASGSEDQTVRLWNVRSGQEVRILQGHGSAVRSVAFAADGNTLASGSDDKTIRLWNVATGHSITSLLEHSNSVWSVVYSPRSKILASGSTDQTIRLWDSETGQVLKTLQGHTNWILSVAYSPDGKTLASGSDDSTVKLLALDTHKITPLQGHTNWVWSVAYSPDGQILASASDDRTVRLWNPQTGQSFKTLVGHKDWVLGVAFSPDGTQLASASADRTVRLWDIAGQPLQTLTGHTDWVRSVAFSPDGHLLASASTDRTIRLWDIPTGQPLKVLQGHANWVRSVAFSPDGHLLASASTDETAILWNVRSGKMVKALRGHTDWVLCVAFSLDGRILASGSTDCTIKLWDVLTGDRIKTLRGHTDSVQAVAYCRDGYLASCSKDQTIKLWHYDGSCLQTFKGNQPYQEMNITGVSGLSEAQLSTLQALGAVR